LLTIYFINKDKEGRGYSSTLKEVEMIGNLHTIRAYLRLNCADLNLYEFGVKLTHMDNGIGIYYKGIKHVNCLVDGENLGD
ncbi:hypothetical protein ACJX0J_023699, partial [Zea mays]